MSDLISPELISKIMNDFSPEELRERADMIQAKQELSDEKYIKHIYDNHKKCSEIILGNIRNKDIILSMVIGLTQSGKTGVINSLIKSGIEESLLKPKDTYVITGLSSCEWKEQTEERMINIIKPQVNHRDNLIHDSSLENKIKILKNGLIIIDEVHYACRMKQTLHKLFIKLGFYDKEHLLKNNINIVEITATPDGLMYDVNEWKENAGIVKLEPGEGYTSIFDLLEEGRVRQYEPLYCNINKEIIEDNIYELQQLILNFSDDPKYHIIRLPSKSFAKIISEFKEASDGAVECHQYTEETSDTFKNINDLIETEPDKHTAIFIKEKLRCAITLGKRHLGILFERHTNSPNSSTIIQGLAGRITGYDDNGVSVVYTDIPTIKNYRELYNSDFNLEKGKKIHWKPKLGSKTSRNTFTNPILVNGMSTTEDIQSSSVILKAHVLKCKTQEEVKEFYNKHLKKTEELYKTSRGPNNKKPDENGFYRTQTQFSKDQEVRSKEEFERMEQTEGWGIYNDSGNSRSVASNLYRLYPCYADINNKETIEWWFVYML